MKALSIRQPWAWLIVQGIKPVENRTWSTQHRGPTLIHAGQVFDAEGLQWITAAFPELASRLPQQYDLGGIVGVANIVDCVNDYPSRWFFGPHGFVLADARPLPFRRWRGELGFFNVPEDPALTQTLQASTAADAEAAGQERLF